MGQATHEGVFEQTRTASATLAHHTNPGLAVTGQMWGDQGGDTGRVKTRGNPRLLEFGRGGLNGNLYHEACRWLITSPIALGGCIKGKVPVPALDPN